MQHPLDDFTYGQINALVKKIGGRQGVDNILSGKWVVGEPAMTAKIKRTRKLTEPPIDTIIHVDRFASPSYPDWVKKVMHPELEHTGPTNYDLATKVEPWLHDGQKDSGHVRGHVIYDYLVVNKLLDSCLGLADGLAIQQKGIATSRSLYAGQAVFLWRSVVMHHYKRLRVPCLTEDVGQAVVSWYWLDNDCYGNYPALRFAN